MISKKNKKLVPLLGVFVFVLVLFVTVSVVQNGGGFDIRKKASENLAPNIPVQLTNFEEGIALDPTITPRPRLTSIPLPTATRIPTKTPTRTPTSTPAPLSISGHVWVQDRVVALIENNDRATLTFRGEDTVTVSVSRNGTYKASGVSLGRQIAELKWYSSRTRQTTTYTTLVNVDSRNIENGVIKNLDPRF